MNKTYIVMVECKTCVAQYSYYEYYCLEAAELAAEEFRLAGHPLVELLP